MAERKVLLVHETESVREQFVALATRLEMPFHACAIAQTEECLSPLPLLVLVGHAPDDVTNESYSRLIRERLRPNRIPFPRVSVGGATEAPSPVDCYQYGNYMAAMILSVPGIFFSRFQVVDPPAGIVHVDVRIGDSE